MNLPRGAPMKPSFVHRPSGILTLAGLGLDGAVLAARLLPVFDGLPDDTIAMNV